MNTAVLFSSRHGTTAKVAGIIAEAIGPGTAVISLDENKTPDISPFDRVVLGTSIHMGRPRKAMHRFTTETEYKRQLRSKDIALFICCVVADEQRLQQQMELAFPEYLRNKAIAYSVIGGELLRERMNILERMAAKRVSGGAETRSDIDKAELEKFIVAIG